MLVKLKQCLLLVLFTVCVQGTRALFTGNTSISKSHDRYTFLKIIYNLGLAKAVCSQHTLFAKSSKIQIPLTDRKSFHQPNASEACHPIIHKSTPRPRHGTKAEQPMRPGKIKILKSIWIWEKNVANCTDLVLFKAIELQLSERTENDDVLFYLFTQPDGFQQRKQIRIDDDSLFDTSGYALNASFIIIIHGWGGSVDDGPCNSFKDAYAAANYTYNIVCLDWGAISGSVYNPLSYPFAAANAEPVGQETAKLIKYLYGKDILHLERVHVIGFSLGAHVAGSTGFAVNGLLNNTVGRITGLDPAGPLFGNSLGLESRRLQKFDAKFVDVIHTAMCHTGIALLSGHVDFFPNGGWGQGGKCKWSPCLIDKCSHSRANELYTESISNKNAFPSCKCAYYSDDYEPGGCDCSNFDVMNMGEHVPVSAKGIFHLTTNDDAPYSRSL